jgi:hypothetical protein
LLYLLDHLLSDTLKKFFHGVLRGFWGVRFLPSYLHYISRRNSAQEKNAQPEKISFGDILLDFYAHEIYIVIRGDRERYRNFMEDGMKFDLIVTRHTALVEYLREMGLAGEDTEVLSHASPRNVACKHVCGVLPHSLSCLTKTFTEVPLALPPELRGVELTVQQVRQFAGEPVTYRVVASWDDCDVG